MTTRARIVRDAIEFRHPERVPVGFFTRDQDAGDILFYGLWHGDGRRNEWGYEFVHLDDGTMGQAGKPVIPDWSVLGEYRWPTLQREARLSGVAAFKARAEDRYQLGALGLSGFTLYTFLRGFEESLLDFLLQPAECLLLLDRIFMHETRLIELAAEAGLHGVHFADDWGTQEGLIVSPEQWRSLFKERYRAQFTRAHELGLHVWFHSCGDVGAILDEFHDVGVDVMNISQPNAVDIHAAGERLRGKQCFLVPISYQTVGISGTPEEIHAEARRLYNALGTPEGGLIGYVEDYACMGQSEANYRACGDAFRAL